MIFPFVDKKKEYSGVSQYMDVDLNWVNQIPWERNFINAYIFIEVTA